MQHRLRLYALVLIIPILVSCSILLPPGEGAQVATPEDRSLLPEAQVLDIVWEALDPNTSSHMRANWQVMEVHLVKGETVAKQFEGEPITGCWFGPAPPENREIRSAKDYWYVLMTPSPATPEPFYGTPSPTAPPLIPEPFLRQAHFLTDPGSGEIIARKLICVVY